VDLREQFRILRRRWLSIVACLLLGIAAAAFLTIRATPVYASTARLFVSTPTSVDTNSNAYQGALFSEQRVASYADLIKGTTIAQKVIDKLKLDETAPALAGQITSQAVTNTVILEVTASDASADRAHLLAQTFAEVFTAYVPQLESAADPSAAPIKAVISDAATTPTTPVSPRPLVNIGLGAVLGLLIGVGLATLRDQLDTTIRSPEALREAAGAASLGIVHYAADAVKRPLVTELDSHSPRLESFRVLRTNLQFLDVDEKSNIFAVTSPLPGNGKTTTAANLAITLAQAGRRTLLLEADLRRPKIADYLHLEPTVGLTTVLIGLANVDDVTQPFASAAGLDVITSGVMPPNPAELLQSNAMKMLLSELRTRYDVVIVDAPPILPVTDAALLAAAVDGAILVAHHGKSTKDQIVQARARLISVDAKLLGTVLNFVPSKGPSGYGYGYAYESNQRPLTVPGQDLRPPTQLVNAVGGKDLLPPRPSVEAPHTASSENGAVPLTERFDPQPSVGAHAHPTDEPARRTTTGRDLRQ